VNGKITELILKRIGVMFLTLWLVATLIFIASNLLPGDAATASLGQFATKETVEGLRSALGLDQPPLQRYFSWMAALVQGDAGISLVNKQPVIDQLLGRMSNTLFLAALTTAIAIPVALFIGVTSAIWRGSFYDRLVSGSSVLAMSTPEFMVATLMVFVFAVHLGWLPALANLNAASTLDLMKSLLMPVCVLVFIVVAQMARMIRAALISTLQSSYIEMSTLKGATRNRIVLRHAMPNALAPILNSTALALNSLLSGVVFVEIIFNYPGVARLMVDAVSTRDIPLVQACAMVFCSSYLILVTIADIFAIITNPRLRRGRAH